VPTADVERLIRALIIGDEAVGALTLVIDLFFTFVFLGVMFI
jgi:hypothetical protein